MAAPMGALTKLAKIQSAGMNTISCSSVFWCTRK